MARATIFLCLFWAALSAAQPSAELISTKQGLSQGMVFNMLQSAEGFLWVATKDGLNRFDGYRFEVFLPDPFDPFSIGANEIRQLYEDSRGRLWLGYEGGLDVFLPSSGLFFHLPMSADPDFGGYVGSVLEMPDGAIWLECNGVLWKIVLDEAGLQQAAGAFPKFSYSKVEALLPQDSLKFISLLHDGNNTLLATTARGLYRIEGHDTDAPRPVFQRSLGQELLLLAVGLSGELYSFAKDGLWRLESLEDSPARKVIGIPADKSWHIDREGFLWANDGRALHKWRFGNDEIEPVQDLDFQHPFTLTDGFYFTSLVLDRSGNAWTGTSGYGLLKIQTAPSKFQSYLPLASQRQIVEAPDGRLFCLRQPGIIYDGIKLGQGQPNPWFAQIPAGETVCYALFDKESHCWARCYSGKLYRIEGPTQKAQETELNGSGLWIDRQGRILSLTGQALLVHNPKTQQTTPYPFDRPLKFQYNVSNEQTLFFEDREGIVWITAFEGLLKAVPHAGGYRFEHYLNNPQDRGTLSNNFVLCVAEDPREPKRYLWIGTKGGGLNRLDRQTGRLAHYGLEHGLPDRVLYGMLPDSQGQLWISTNNGLCRMAVEDGIPVFKNFTADDGLQGDEFNQSSFLKMKDGTLLFGGVNGLTVFHPDSLRFRNNPPPIRIVGIRAGGQWRSVQDAQPLEIRHDQNLLLFEFAALDFTNPAQNQYRYQLLRRSAFGGQPEAAWMDLGHSNSVQLAQLPPGHYTFRVMGSDNEGTWSTAAAEAVFVIHPPWWAAWWAYLGYAGLLALALAAYIRFRLHRRLVEQEALRLRELDEFKNRFFTNITHEFRTPLTIILGNLEIEKLEIGKFKRLDDSPRISQFLHFLTSKNALLKRNSENLLRLINQILDLVKLENNSLTINYVQGDILAYLRYLTESLHSLAQTRGVRLHVQSLEAEIVMDYDPERILQLAHNLLSNAIKFTPSGGEVVLEIGVSDIRNREIGRLGQAGNFPVSQSPHLQLSVRDTGTGIPPEALPYIFDRFYQAENLEKAKAGGTGIGLALTRELVQAMGGHIHVESAVGQGTTFTVTLPIHHRAAAASLVAVRSEQGARGNSQGAIGDASSSQHPSLLITEDNPDVMEYLAACLGEHYQLDFAYDGRAGIERALETVPDLIVSDVMMPEKDGFEVVQTLKNDERTSHIPIVLLTAKADVESRIAGLRRGADAYLAKPFHREELLVTLVKLLELRRKLQERYSRLGIGRLGSGGEISNVQILVPSAVAADPEDAFLQKVRALVEEDLSNSEWDMQYLEQALAMSRSQVFRKVKALTGKSPSQFVRSIRLHHGRRRLLETGLTVSEIAYEVGFSSVKYFSDAFVEEFGERPTQVRE